MKIRKGFYANIAVIQFTYWFNKQNNTFIKAFSETMEGTPLVTIDFGDLNAEVIFEYSFQLGEIHQEAVTENRFAIRSNRFPLPPKNDPNYSFD